MADFNKTESARWEMENAKRVGELHAGVDKALAEAASRGFTATPGVTLALILAAGQDSKSQLTEFNGAKIYDDRRGVIFQQDEFAMKIIVQVAKLAMEFYREELMNALAIEQAESYALRDEGRADVERMNSEVDARQVAIIRDRAEIERRITILKEALVDAETVTLVSERALVTAQLGTTEKKLEVINSIYEVIAAEGATLGSERELITAQLATAEKKLEVVNSTYPVLAAEAATLTSERGLVTAQIATAQEKLEVINSIYELLTAERTTMTVERALIDAQIATADKKLEIIESIYQVLAAEKLVLVAERRRAESLEKVLEAQRILAIIKEEMVPFYMDKAKAKEELAEAVTLEVPIREDLERLGYDRIGLKTRDEYVDHLLREANEDFEIAQMGKIKAEQVTELARAKAHRVLQEYTNKIRASILNKKRALEEDGIDFKLDTALQRTALDLNNKKEITDHERGNLTMELSNLLNNMEAQATDQQATIMASAQQALLGIVTNITTFRQINKG